MHRCHQCGKVLHELPYKCRRCGNIFCSDHHLPENHNCSRHHHHDYKPQQRFCGNCGREITGMPYHCHRCGRGFCDHCRRPEIHGCNVDSPTPAPDTPPKKTPKQNFDWGKIREYLTLEHFTIISILIIIVGFLFRTVHPDSTFQTFLTVGLVCFAFAYFLYSVKCWGAGNYLHSVLLLTIPLFVYTLSTTKIMESSITNIGFYLFILFCIYAVLSAVMIYVSNLIKTAIEEHILKIHRYHRRYFFPNISYSIIGVIVVSFLLMNAQTGSVFSENTNLVLKSAINTNPYSQISSDSPTNSSIKTTVIQTPISYQLSSTREIPAPPNLETGATTRTFDYVLRGRSGSITTTLYSGIENYLGSISKPATCVRYNGDPSSCTQEETRLYYLKYLDESSQKKTLNELVSRIKSQTSNKDDQARIAISLVQNIPYDYNSLNSRSTDMKYPYEVLYQNTGVCSEKSLLLAYLLRELGYGVVLFEFESENHMAIGIKSPSQYSYKNSGYAFIEATTPSIVTDSNGDYVGAGKLTSSPEIMQISQGDTFSSVSEEYLDAQLFNQLLSMGQVLDISHYNQWVGLMQKYGMKTTGGSLSQVTAFPTYAYNVQTNSATCNVDLGQFCQVGSNCCRKNGLCYSQCTRGTWDPQSCTCLVG